MAKMRAAQTAIKKPFRCSSCKRYFDKIENVTCHITRNAICSREGASVEDLRNQRPGLIAVVAESEVKEDLNPVPRNREKRDIILQSDRKKGTPRLGMRF